MWVRVPPPELSSWRASARQLLDQLGTALSAVVLRGPSLQFFRLLGEGRVLEHAQRSPAQWRWPAEAPGEGEATPGPGDPHRRLAHVADDRADQDRGSGRERASHGPVAAVRDDQ